MIYRRGASGRFRRRDRFCRDKRGRFAKRVPITTDGIYRALAGFRRAMDAIIASDDCNPFFSAPNMAQRMRTA